MWPEGRASGCIPLSFLYKWALQAYCLNIAFSLAISGENTVKMKISVSLHRGAYCCYPGEKLLYYIYYLLLIINLYSETFSSWVCIVSCYTTAIHLYSRHIHLYSFSWSESPLGACWQTPSGLSCLLLRSGFRLDTTIKV